VFGNEGLDIAHVLEAVKVRKIARWLKELMIYVKILAGGVNGT
jgi:hypothetical protein